jgi:hypothetical protein
MGRKPCSRRGCQRDADVRKRLEEAARIIVKEFSVVARQHRRRGGGGRRRDPACFVHQQQRSNGDVPPREPMMAKGFRQLVFALGERHLQIGYYIYVIYV